MLGADPREGAAVEIEVRLQQFERQIIRPPLLGDGGGPSPARAVLA
jgi:hypothetical protein